MFAWIKQKSQEKKRQFDEWLESGGRHSHPALLDAFAGAGVPAGKGQPRVVALGNLIVRSGYVVVGDPAYATEDGASDYGSENGCFDEQVPIGEFPVSILMLGEQVSGLRLLFNTESISHLEPAFTTATREWAKQKQDLPAFGVDSATATLFSAESLAAYRADPESISEAIGDYYRPGLDAPWVEVKFPDGTNAFSGLSGKGDGLYPVYFGKTADRQIAALFVDFCELGKAERIRATRHLV